MKGHDCTILLIVINNGEVYVLDCIKMILLNHEDGRKGSVVQCKVPEYSSMDLMKDKLLTVSEGGDGRLTTVSRNSEFSYLSPGRGVQHRRYLFTPYLQDFIVMPSSSLVRTDSLVISVLYRELIQSLV